MTDNEYHIQIHSRADLGGAQPTAQMLNAVARQAAGVAAAVAQAAGKKHAATAAAQKLGEAAGNAARLARKGLTASAGQFEAMPETLRAVYGPTRVPRTSTAPGERSGNGADASAGSSRTGVALDLGQRLVESVAELPRVFAQAQPTFKKPESSGSDGVATRPDGYERQRGRREAFTVPGGQDPEQGSSLQAGGLTASTLDGDAASASGPGFPTAAEALAPAVSFQQTPDPSAAAGATAPGSDGLTAAAAKFGAGADAKLGQAGETIGRLSDQWLGAFDALAQRLQQIEGKVETAQSQINNRA